MEPCAQPPAERYGEIDLLRTVAILCMILYHSAFDLAFFFNVPLDPLAGGWFWLQRFTANLFLLIVGISFAISYGRMERRNTTLKEMLKKYAKRAALLLLCATGISAVTLMTVGDAWVRFGALHLIGFSLLLLPFLMPLKEGTALLAILILLLSPLLKNLSIDTPLLLPFCVPPRGFTSVDYLPLIPWMAPILLGTATGNVLYNRGWLRWHLVDHPVTRIFALPGQHALLLYLVHQPLLLALFRIIL